MIDPIPRLWECIVDECARNEDDERMLRIVVGVDPAVTSEATSDETCIVVAGLGTDRNHSDYKFEVVCGPIEDIDNDDACECHALICTDGHVAVTLYEGCYAMWRLSDGVLICGSLWEKGAMRLCEKAVYDIMNGRLS